MTQGALHFRGIDPFTEQSLEFWVVDGRITFEPVASAETAVDGGWIVPGLVDAHNHVGIAPGLDVTIEQATHGVRLHESIMPLLTPWAQKLGVALPTSR